jgi:hypothetical protein
MSSARNIKLLCLLIIVLFLAGSMLGSVRVAYGLNAQNSSNAQEIVTGSGSAGSGSLAVAMFFSFSAANGAGSFSGDLHANLGYSGGLFRLTVSNPANAPLLPCPTGQLSAGGSVTSGSFLGEQVLFAACLGIAVPGLFVIYHSTPSNPDFSGQGTGSATYSKANLKAMFTAESVASGSGTAGPGTIYTAEADAVLRDNSLVTGGAFVGTVSDQPSGNIWNGFSATVPSGCTLTTSGVTASFGSFPKQPVSSSYTPLTCPPSSIGPQPASFIFVLGDNASPIFKATGDGRIEGQRGFAD